MKDYCHSVELIAEKCIGCTDCIKRCPTEAIRIRNGKAIIIAERCIDCGLCIKVCQNYAKKATTDNMSIIKNYSYKIAIPAPTLYGQLKNVYDINAILTSIKQMGFDDVFEVSKAAEMVTEATKKYIMTHEIKKPIISSACPVIVRLISMRFPSLLENILPIIAPVEVAAKIAKELCIKKGMNKEDIGVFFISPCAAKCTYVKNPLGVDKSEIDGVISIQDIFIPLRSKLKRLSQVEALAQTTESGIDWAITGGEIKGVFIENAIAVDGVENVIKVLEELENGQLEDVDFIEGLACNCGCIGGPLTVENGFVAKSRLKKVEKEVKNIPQDKKRIHDLSDIEINYEFTKPILPAEGLALDSEMSVALEKMENINNIYHKLPLIDCSSCGAPTCRALAEDIINGEANIEDCIFMLREKVKDLAESMVNLSSKLPQTINAKKNTGGADI